MLETALNLIAPIDKWEAKAELEEIEEAEAQAMRELEEEKQSELYLLINRK